MSHQYFGITALALIGVLWGAPGCDGLQDDGDGTRQTNIQFGKATQKWPQVGELLSNHRCTGTLIAPNAVLTAAHCISSAATMFHVDKDGARTSYNITTQVGHPSCSRASRSPPRAFLTSASDLSSLSVTRCLPA